MWKRKCAQGQTRSMSKRTNELKEANLNCKEPIELFRTFNAQPLPISSDSKRTRNDAVRRLHSFVIWAHSIVLLERPKVRKRRTKWWEQLANGQKIRGRRVSRRTWSGRTRWNSVNLKDLRNKNRISSWINRPADRGRVKRERKEERVCVCVCKLVHLKTTEFITLCLCGNSNGSEEKREGEPRSGDLIVFDFFKCMYHDAAVLVLLLIELVSPCRNQSAEVSSRKVFGWMRPK